MSAGGSGPTRPSRPLYARALRLRHLDLGGVGCFLFFEGMIALGILLALAELASWWAVAVLPAAVAAMVKVNDLVAGALRVRHPPRHAVIPPVAGPASRAAPGLSAVDRAGRAH